MVGQHNDAALAVGLFVLGGVFTVLWWFIRSKFQQYDAQHTKHFEHSGKLEIHQESMSRETLNLCLKAIEERLDHHIREDERMFKELSDHRTEVRNTLHWLGDCIMMIGVRMEIDLPERPPL